MNFPVLSACLFLVPLSLIAGQSQRSVVTTQQAGQHKASNNTGKTGEQVFATNCSRCHAAPMSLSPRITGTVVMHMRARARLSQQDEQLLLKFLAP
jgi:cytochrome c5